MTDAPLQPAPPAEAALMLTPPEPVQAIAPAKATGLVPVEDAKKTELESRVDAFIDGAQALEKPLAKLRDEP